MTVTFYSFTKKENSTSRPSSGGVDHTGVLRESCDTLAPSIGFDFGQSNNPATYNYAYVAAFSRYYWIVSWTWEGGLWWANMSVDALASWKTYIGNSTNYVLRAASASDGTIVDTLYPAKAVNTVARNTFSTFSGESVVVGVASRARSSQGAITYYSMTLAQFSSVADALFSTSTWTDMVFDQSTGLSDDGITEPLFKALFNPMQYVVSAMWFPFSNTAAVQPSSNEIALGWWLTGVTAPVVSQKFATLTVTPSISSHPQAASRGAYLNKPPYTKTYICVKPFGVFELDAMRISTGSLDVSIDVDLTSGIGKLLVYSGDAELLNVQTKVGIDIALYQRTQDVLGAGTALMNNTAAAIGSGLQGNIIGTITGGISGVADAVQNLVPRLTGISGGGNWASWYLGSNYVEQDFLTVVDEDNATLGRPLCQQRTLNTLAGYQLIASPEISAPCTQTELETIINYMAGGYFYE